MSVTKTRGPTRWLDPSDYLNPRVPPPNNHRPYKHVWRVVKRHKQFVGREIPDFGKRGVKVARRMPSKLLGRIMWPILIGTVIDEVWEAMTVKRHTGALKPMIPGAWVQQRDCANTSIDAMTGTATGCGPWSSTNCLAGQAGSWTALDPSGVLYPTPGSKFRLGRGYHIQPSGEKRAEHRQWMYRDCSYPSLSTWEPERYRRQQTFTRQVFRWGYTDPNRLRSAPSIPPVVPPPAAPPPAPEPEPLERQPETGRSFGPGGPGFSTTVQPSLRQPPRKNEKEKKNGANRAGRQLMVTFFRAADVTSELSEIVDAFFEALPEEVQRRWSRGRGNRQFLDKAGQYGIDGADWKLQALWYNWHLLDTEKALTNVINNAAQDLLLGKLHQVAPRNKVNAFEDAYLSLNKMIEDEIFLDEHAFSDTFWRMF